MMNDESTTDHSPNVSGPGSEREAREDGRRQDASYNMPDNYTNLNEVMITRIRTSQDGLGHASQEPLERRESLFRTSSRRSSRRVSHAEGHHDRTSYDIPDRYANLDELATPPIENPDEEPIYLHQSLEESRRAEQEYQRNKEEERRASIARGEVPRIEEEGEEPGVHKISRTATELYVISYLVLFSFFGTLARLGLQAITFYSGAPVVFTVLWPNLGGSMLMGFLGEDRMLFKEEWGVSTYDQLVEKARQQVRDEEGVLGSEETVDLQAAKKAHVATKKTIPLYIGLATGFCGCFTSFSSFMRDVYFALANELPTPLNHPEDYNPVRASTTSTVSRNGGFSFMALLAVIITTIAVCVSGLRVGAHIAIASEPFIPSIPFAITRKILDRIAVVLAWGCWIGAIILAALPPDRNDGVPDTWRGRALFALVFAPLGCLGRFYASIYLNGRIASFPLGTFVVNILGTAILGMCYDLQHIPLGGVVGCQVLQGVEDGFCGCLTTVSTWVAELSSLRRRNAYRYGAASVMVALCCLVVVMGSMQWTRGFGDLKCTH
jgi:CrcB protein